MLFPNSSAPHFHTMQSDAYPTPTIAAWHLRTKLICGNTSAQPPLNTSAAAIFDPDHTPPSCPKAAINQLITTAETLAADLNMAQINYVWRSCEAIYGQNGCFVN